MKEFYELCMEIELELKRQMENGEKITYSAFKTRENDKIVENWITSREEDREYYDSQLEQLDAAAKEHNFIYMYNFFLDNARYYSTNVATSLIDSDFLYLVYGYEAEKIEVYATGFLVDKISKEEILEALDNKEFLFYLQQEGNEHLYTSMNEKLGNVLV